MNNNLPEYIDRFAGLRVLIIGEAMLDSYLEGETNRLCREAPVPIVAVARRKDVPGGAANTAVNIASLGGQVHFLSVMGDDNEARLIARSLEKRGISTRFLIRHPGRATLAKHRIIAASQILLRYDQGDTGPIDSATEKALISRLQTLFPRADAVIISDYGYGILTPAVIEALADLQARCPRVLVLDAKNPALYREVGVTAVKPNYGETLQLLGVKSYEGENRAEWIASQSERILEITGAKIAAVTLDTEGSLVIERRKPLYRTYATPMPNSKATGAGDTFVSTLALALAAGAHTTAAAELASAAAAIVVLKDGTVACSAAELREHFLGGAKYFTGLARLAARMELYREQGKKIVFTNGCFDILHPGHINFLNQAKDLGDVLVVGVNSDESVRRLKGANRPINTLEDRLQVLSALSCIDHLVSFEEDLPTHLIQAICPDIFVKGGNYTRDILPETALVEGQGGKVVILPYLAERSTHGLIERIREGFSPPAQSYNGMDDGYAYPA